MGFCLGNIEAQWEIEEMARPLTKTYSPTHPYVVQRHDQDDGSITYEIWDERPDSYRRLCSINERNDSLEYDEDDGKPPHNAKSDAELIVRALNLMLGGLPETMTGT